MGYAFISYSSMEKNMADSMRRLLEKNGIASWMAPYDIPPGKKYVQVINAAIKKCDCVVLMLSEAAQNSSWVPKEIERAIHYKKMIISVKLEDMVLNEEFELYISTDQIVEVKNLSENSPEVQKILKSAASACGGKIIGSSGSKGPIKKSKFALMFIVFATIGVAVLVNQKPLDQNPSDIRNERIDEEIKEIPFLNISETEEYRYPFRGFCGFSFEKNSFLLENKMSGSLALIDTESCMEIPGNKEIDWQGGELKDTWLLSSENSDIMYFLNELDHEIGIYDSVKNEWIVQNNLRLDVAEYEYPGVSFVGSPNLVSDLVDEDDIFIFFYDWMSDESCYTKIVHVTPEGEVFYTNIDYLKLADVVCGFERNVSTTVIPVFAWDMNEKPVLFDLLNGQILDIEFKEIYEKYLPYAISDNQHMSSDGRYVLRVKDLNTDIEATAYMEICVWDMDKGEIAFKDKVIGGCSAYFGKDNEIYFYNGNLKRIDLETKEEEVLVAESYFRIQPEFGELPFSFYFSDSLELCIWDVATIGDNGELYNSVIISDLNGEVLYRYRDMEVPFDIYSPITYVGDDFILHSLWRYENLEMITDSETEESSIYSIPWKVSYIRNPDGEIQLK